MKTLNDLMRLYYRLIQDMLDGVGALTVQPYVEVNVKKGVQHEYSIQGTLPAGGSANLIHSVGNNPVIIKSRELSIKGTRLDFDMYKGAVYSGGTAVPIYNLTGISPQSSQCSLFLGSTITNQGTKIAAPRRVLSSDGIGGVLNTANSADGLERILAPNTNYLDVLSNNSTDPLDYTMYITFYEGPLDYLPE